MQRKRRRNEGQLADCKHPNNDAAVAYAECMLVVDVAVYSVSSALEELGTKQNLSSDIAKLRHNTAAAREWCDRDNRLIEVARKMEKQFLSLPRECSGTFLKR